MKRYVSCFFLFISMSIICAMTAVSLRMQERREESLAALEESIRSREQEIREMMAEVPAANRAEISHELADHGIDPWEYYLVCEDGFLLVFQKDRQTICLYTHIPITDFPEDEQEKIREGIGFESMMDVMNYLESYTS